MIFNIAPLAVFISFVGIIKGLNLISRWDVKEGYIEKGNKFISLFGVILVQLPIIIVSVLKPDRTVSVPPYGEYDYASVPFSFSNIFEYYLIGAGIIFFIFILYKLFPGIRELIDLLIGR